jgi:hypothetical protein
MLETKSAPFTFVKQGIFYFSRRVPSDLSHHYNASRIINLLRRRPAAVGRATHCDRGLRQALCLSPLQLNGDDECQLGKRCPIGV